MNPINSKGEFQGTPVLINNRHTPGFGRTELPGQTGDQTGQSLLQYLFPPT